jgi:hypothetical protein
MVAHIISGPTCEVEVEVEEQSLRTTWVNVRGKPYLKNKLKW